MVAQLDNLYLKTRPLKGLTRLLGYGLFEGRPLTTKGQWINPLVLAQFSLVKRLPQIKKVRAPIFILGTGRSGTTILGVVLSMHEAVGFLNEPKALWFSVNPKDDLIGSYSRAEAQYVLSEQDASPEVRQAAHRLYAYYQSLTGSRRVVDKYPEMIFRVPFVKAIFPDAKFIFLVRNGWDTIESIEHWSERLGVTSGEETHDWWGANNRKWQFMLEQLLPLDPLLSQKAATIATYKRHEDMAAVEWILTMNKGLEVLQTYQSSVYRLHYELLVQQPRQVATTLTEFLELETDPVFLDYAEKVLRPAGAKKPVDLHEAIRAPFREVMDLLGYV